MVGTTQIFRRRRVSASLTATCPACVRSTAVAAFLCLLLTPAFVTAPWRVGNVDRGRGTLPARPAARDIIGGEPDGDAADLAATLAAGSDVPNGVVDAGADKDVVSESETGGDDAAGGGITDVEEMYVSGEEDGVSKEVLWRVNLVSKAHSGKFKAPQGVPDTERGVGAITGALKTFPGEHEFQAVGRTASAEARDAFIRTVVDAVALHTGEVPKESVFVKERKGGKFTSVTVKQVLQSADQVGRVLNELDAAPEVLMHW